MSTEPKYFDARVTRVCRDGATEALQWRFTPEQYRDARSVVEISVRAEDGDDTPIRMPDFVWDALKLRGP